MTDRTCGNCQFFERFPNKPRGVDEIAGECILYPPKVLAVDEDGVTQALPFMLSTDRCGQFRAVEH